MVHILMVTEVLTTRYSIDYETKSFLYRYIVVEYSKNFRYYANRVLN